MSDINIINEIEAGLDRISAEYEEKEAFVDKYAERGNLALKSFALVLKMEIDEGKTLVKIAKELLAELKKKEDVKMSKDCNCKTKDLSLPKWCKEGQWVVAKFDLEMNKRVKDCVLKRIVEVGPFGGITAETPKGEREHDAWSGYVPIIYRPYTYEEAKKLLGKVIESTSDNGKRKYLSVITDVDETEDDIHVNGWLHLHWSRINATIDGVPMGVPVVDEDAMLEDEQ